MCIGRGCKGIAEQPHSLEWVMASGCFMCQKQQTIIPAVTMVCVYLWLLPLKLKWKWLGGSRNITLPWNYTAPQPPAQGAGQEPCLNAPQMF